MTTDKEVLSWKNRAAEAESKRVAAENRLAKLERTLDAARKALGEAQAIFHKFVAYDFYRQGVLRSNDDKVLLKKSEFIHAENMMRQARAGIAPMPTVGEVYKKLPDVNTNIPDSPQTNDYYMDEEGNLHWFYLGKWHKGRERE